MTDNTLTSDQTITVGELAEALRRVRHSVSALTLYENIKANREPEWKGGEVVRDANDTFWRRSRVAPTWYRFGYPEDYSHDRPVRPLILVGRERA